MAYSNSGLGNGQRNRVSYRATEKIIIGVMGFKATEEETLLTNLTLWNSEPKFL